MPRTGEAHALGPTPHTMPTRRAARAGGLRVLFGSLVLLLAAYPFLEEGLLAETALLLMSTVIVLSGAYAASTTRRELAVALLLAMPVLVVGWTSLFVDSRAWRGATSVATITFYAYILLLVLARVLRSEEVTAEELLGALSVYILIGLVFGAAHNLVEDLLPGSFTVRAGFARPADLTYYSFITLLTVGYGEITPASPTARSLTVLEAMIGVVFVAVLIARLVGLHARGGHR